MTTSVEAVEAVRHPVVPAGAAPAEPVGPGRRWRPWVAALAASAAYLVAAVVVWWPVWTGGHPASVLTCGCGDPAQSAWSLAHVWSAISHGTSPFASTAIFAPGGSNLLDNTSAIAVGVVLAPVTALFGPVVALNAAVTLAPVVSALAAYVAARRFVDWAPAAFAAGLLYGFSPFVLDAAFLGHLQFAVLFFPPLLLVVLHELLVRQRWPVVWTGAALGGLFAVQFFVGTEMLALTVTVAVLATAALAVVYRGQVRSHLPYVARGVAVAAVGAGVVLAWPLWFALAGPWHFTGTQHPGIANVGNTLGGIVTTGPASAPTLLGIFYGYAGPRGPQPLYLGIPLVVVLLAGSVVLRRRPIVRWMLGLAAATVVLAAGSAFSDLPFVAPKWWAPWRLFARLPLLAEAGPSHLAGVALVFVAVLFAVILDRLREAVRGRRGRTAGPVAGAVAAVTGVLVVAVASLAPMAVAVGVPATVQAAGVPAYFSAGAPGVPSGTALLVYPFPSALDGSPLLWQAADGMRYRLVGGYGFEPGQDGGKLDANDLSTGYGVLASLDDGNTVHVPAATALAEARATADAAAPATAVVIRTTPPALYFAALAFYTAMYSAAPTVDGGAWVWTHLDRAVPPEQIDDEALAFCAALGPAVADPLAVPDCVLGAGGARR